MYGESHSVTHTVTQSLDRNLNVVVEAWPGLPQAAKEGTLRMVTTALKPMRPQNPGESGLILVTTMFILKLPFLLLRGLLSDRAQIVAEDLALRQQLGVMQRSVKRPKLANRDRVFWAFLSLLRDKWRTSLVIVKPETAIKWHRRGFKLYWRWKSRRKVGRPKTDREVRVLMECGDEWAPSVMNIPQGVDAISRLRGYHSVWGSQAESETPPA